MMPSVYLRPLAWTPQATLNLKPKLTIMIIGTMFLGKVKEINKQWIETKFFIVGVPLFPTSSILVTSATSYNSRQGISIPLNATSVIAGYARLITFLAALGFFITGAADADTTMLLIGMAFAITWAYFYFNFGKPSTSEISERSKLGKAIGVYALPNWYDFDGAMNNLNHLQFHYKGKFTSDWKSDLSSGNVSQDKVPVLYALAVFNYMVDQSPANDDLLNKANKLYR
jgi:hypothetical protein